MFLKHKSKDSDSLKLVGDVWLNTEQPIDNLAAGKVTLIEFWTFGCNNCKNTMPHMQALWSRLKNSPDFQFVGVHRPEFDFEHTVENVENAVRELSITWPVLIDNTYDNWNRFNTHYWPSFFVFDKNGAMVHSQVGEGKYRELETVITNLL